MAEELIKVKIIVNKQMRSRKIDIIFGKNTMQSSKGKYTRELHGY
jgi:hypothetical protein